MLAETTYTAVSSVFSSTVRGMQSAYCASYTTLRFYRLLFLRLVLSDILASQR